MSSTQADEVPFLSGMERDPDAEGEKPGWHDVTVKVGRDLWSLHGMAHAAKEIVSSLAQTVRSVAERGPKDYYEESGYERGVRDGAKLGGYHEAPKNLNGGNSSWQKWMVGLCGTLVTAGVIGIVVMYGKLSAVEANQVSQQKQLDNLTQMLMNLTRRNP